MASYYHEAYWYKCADDHWCVWQMFETIHKCSRQFRKQFQKNPKTQDSQPMSTGSFCLIFVSPSLGTKLVTRNQIGEAKWTKPIQLCIANNVSVQMKRQIGKSWAETPSPLHDTSKGHALVASTSGKWFCHTLDPSIERSHPSRHWSFIVLSYNNVWLKMLNWHASLTVIVCSSV